MIQRTHRSKIVTITVVTWIIFVIHLFTIVTNLSIATPIEEYGLPDILIYPTALSFLVIGILTSRWLVLPKANLAKGTLKIFMGLALANVFLYFLSLYTYKFTLLSETISIIRYRILEGNPALVFDYSRDNYWTLKSILAIFTGLNSEVILFAEAMVFQVSVFSLRPMELVEEPKYEYDEFLFDRKIVPLSILYVLTAFLSINLLKWTFDALGTLEMTIAITGFLSSMPAIIAAFRIQGLDNNECTRSFFLTNHRLILASTLFGLVMFGSLAVLNVSFFASGRGTYRIVSSVLAFLFALLLFLKSRRSLSLENK